MHPQSIFIARTEEQESFLRTLESQRRGRIKRWFPTFLRIIRGPQKNDQPHIFLLYGEGGMGKSHLVRRFKTIVESERRYKNHFDCVYLDWDSIKDPDLVNHRKVHPETVFSVLYEELAKKGLDRYFSDYRKLTKKIKDLEARVKQKIESSPDTELNKKISQLGSKAIIWIARKYTGLDGMISQDSLEKTLDDTIQVSAELLYQSRKLLQSILETNEIEILTRPHDKIANEFGNSLAAAAQRKPLVVMMDTYEIVDRLECDYALRSCMQKAGENVVWVIVGRSNLSKSRRLGNIDFRGYRQDFQEDKIYAKKLAEFGRPEIRKYFECLCPDQTPSSKDIERLAHFSRGIPLIVAEASILWRQGISMQEIVEPVPDYLNGSTPHEALITGVTERFLIRCSGENRKCVYAMALLRIQNPDLLQKMLGKNNLEENLNRLSYQFPFIIAERAILNERLAEFMHEYMMAPVRQNDFLIKQLNDSAIEYLEEKMGSLTNLAGDTRERISDESVANVILDLSHHYFWRSEECGWKFTLLRFVEAWAYNPTLTKGLLSISERFKPIFSDEGLKRFRVINEIVENLSFSVETFGLAERLLALISHTWSNLKGYQECKSILFVQSSRGLRQRGLEQEAFLACEKAEENLPEASESTKKFLADEYYFLSTAIIWSDKNSGKIAFHTSQGEEAIKKAIKLDSNNSYYHYCHAAIHHQNGRFEDSKVSCKKAIEIRPRYAKPYNMLGIICQAQGNYIEAIEHHKKAIEIDEKFPSPYINLARAYSMRKEFSQAISTLNLALRFEDKRGQILTRMARAYRLQGNYELALETYKKSIDLEPDIASAHGGIGVIELMRGNPRSAILSIKKAIEIESKEPSHYFNIGNAYAYLGESEESRFYWSQGINLCTSEVPWYVLAKRLYEYILYNRENEFLIIKGLIRENCDVGCLENILRDVELLNEMEIDVNGLNELSKLLKQRIKKISNV